MKTRLIMMAIALLGLAACQEEDVIVPTTPDANVTDTTDAGGAADVSSIVPTVKEVDTTTITATGFTAEWEPVDGADLYELKVREEAATNGRSMAWDTLIVVSEGTQYILEDLESGKTYHYAVRAKIGEDYTKYTEEIMIELLNDECLIPNWLQGDDLNAWDAFTRSLLCKTFVYDGSQIMVKTQWFLGYREDMPEHDRLEITFTYISDIHARLLLNLYQGDELVSDHVLVWSTRAPSDEDSPIYRLNIQNEILSDGTEITQSLGVDFQYDSNGDLLFTAGEHRFRLKN
jgi:hypothetical protein